MSVQRQILLTGASGYVGGLLLPELVKRGHHVRCLARSPERLDLPAGAEAVEGDAVEGTGLEAALEGIDVAYYLIHSMGKGASTSDFAERDRRAARNFGDAAAAARVRRVAYLGGLEAPADAESEHLRSREEVAEILAERARAPNGGVSEVVHVRAAMIIGSGSASFEMLRALVERLPVMICPRWIDTRTQPVAVGDVVDALGELSDRDEVPDEVQLGGADVLSYRDMMDRFASASGLRRRPKLRTPFLSPRLSSYWVGLVTPVDASLARPLVHGLAAELVVDSEPPAGINDRPLGFDAAVRAALDAA